MSNKQMIQRIAQRTGRGTHGSLTKAGKVRDMTRQLKRKRREDAKDRLPTIPRKKNRSKYIERIFHNKIKPLSLLPIPTRQVRGQMYGRKGRGNKGHKDTRSKNTKRSRRTR